MKWWFTSFILFVPYISSQDLYIDKSKWINPSDMLEDVPTQMRRKHGEAQTGNRDITVVEETEIRRYSTLLGTRNTNLGSDGNYENEQSRYRVNVTVFFQRHIARLLAKLAFQSPMQDTQYYQLRVELSDSQRKTLKEFAASYASLHEVDEILTDIFLDAEPVSYDGVPFTFLFTSVPFQTIGVTLSILGTFYLIMRLSVFRVLLLLFVVSFVWNCQQMYQSAIAKRHSEMMKNAGEAPRHCKPKDWGWWENVKFWLHEADECHEYHKMLIVDPIWDVNPAVAASDAVAMFVLHPLERLGGQIGLFYKNLYKQSPLFAFWFILPMSFIIILVVICASFGYSISTAYGLLSIQPRPLAPSIAQPIAPSIAQPIAPSIAQPIAPSIAQPIAPSIAENHQLSRKRIESSTTESQKQLKDDEKKQSMNDENVTENSPTHPKQIKELNNENSSNPSQEQGSGDTLTKEKQHENEE